MTIRTTFDGKKSVLPKELVGHEPCDVEIVLDNGPANGDGHPSSSIWDVVARSRGTLNPQTILRDVSAGAMTGSMRELPGCQCHYQAAGSRCAHAPGVDSAPSGEFRRFYHLGTFIA